MPKGREITSSLRDQAVGLWIAGTSYRKISDILGLNYSTVYYIIKKYRSTGYTKNQPRKGRPNSISVRASRQLNSIVKSHRKTTLRGMTEIFNAGKNVPVSEKTVSRNLHKLGFYARRACRKPLISTRNKIKRLEYYNIHKSWGVAEWKNIIFSDESKFNLFHSDGRVKVWRRPNERYLPECTRKA